MKNANIILSTGLALSLITWGVVGVAVASGQIEAPVLVGYEQIPEGVPDDSIEFCLSYHDPHLQQRCLRAAIKVFINANPPKESDQSDNPDQ